MKTEYETIQELNTYGWRGDDASVRDPESPYRYREDIDPLRVFTVKYSSDKFVFKVENVNPTTEYWHLINVNLLLNNDVNDDESIKDAIEYIDNADIRVVTKEAMMADTLVITERYGTLYRFPTFIEYTTIPSVYISKKSDDGETVIFVKVTGYERNVLLDNGTEYRASFRESKRAIGIKAIDRIPMTYGEFLLEHPSRALIDEEPTPERLNMPGYKVIYMDGSGYSSWSPKDVADKAYLDAVPSNVHGLMGLLGGLVIDAGIDFNNYYNNDEAMANKIVKLQAQLNASVHMSNVLVISLFNSNSKKFFKIKNKVDEGQPITYTVYMYKGDNKVAPMVNFDQSQGEATSIETKTVEELMRYEIVEEKDLQWFLKLTDRE